MAAPILVARNFGDLSENAEYDEAKNEQGRLEARIIVLERTIRNAEIIREGSRGGVISVGSSFEVEDEFGTQKLTLVGPTEADVAGGRISQESPVGKALLGHKVGESVSVKSPGGDRLVKIIAIEGKTL